MEQWHSRAVEELVTELHSGYEGLGEKEAKERLETQGKNQLNPAKKKNILWRIFAQLKDPMILVLLAAAGLSYWASGGEDWLDAVIILVIISVNSMISLSQEDHAQRALEALEEMTAPLATVLREGKEISIPACDVVVGDVIVLHTGDKVPADGRLLKAVSLQMDESTMTGESMAVDKRLCNALPEDTPVGDWCNMVLSGTLVTGGQGRALVVATGMNTQLGKIAELLEETQGQISPLQVKMGEVSKNLSFLCLAVCGLMFGIGLLQGQDMLSLFMTAVALAVAAIPEGLPAVVSIVLALGTSRMAERGAIIKKLPAVETLGSASVICSDKTGTLTQNKMSVQDCYVLPNTRRRDALQAALLCSNAQITWNGGKPEIRGSPTESALAFYAVKEGIDKDRLHNDYPKVEEIPFDSTRKLMSTLHPNPNGGYLIYVKGAPDVLLKQCTHSLRGRMTQGERQSVLEQNEAMARNSMRVIAVAQRSIAFIPPKMVAENMEQGLTFLGLFGLMDPPRPEVKSAVSACYKAGIKPVMVTGDHRSTALAIAKDLQIYRHGDWTITGAELDFMPQRVLEQDIHRFSVFARVSPQHKMRIVQAWQQRGNVVAVTGDGVNDAPALKTADIGCAMGITGTDVAKGASELILTNDNFNTIVSAVEEGRGIYANIRKAIHYLLSCNIGEIVAIFVGTVFHFATMPLVPVQLLWLNLVTDTLPALALGVEPVEEGLMAQPPREHDHNLFDKAFSLRLVWQGIMVGCLTLFAYYLGYAHLSTETQNSGAVANTMAFATLTLSQLFHAFNVRSEDKSLLTLGLFSNPAMNKAFVLGLGLQLAVLCLTPLQGVFSVVPMTEEQWISVFALAMSPLPFCEAVKWHSRGKTQQGKRVVSHKELKQWQESKEQRQKQEAPEEAVAEPPLKLVEK